MPRGIHVLATAGVLALAACGGGDPPYACGGTSQGTLVTDAQLCRLECGSTTRDQAIAALGQPNMGASTSVVYYYECVSQTRSDALEIVLTFDAGTGALEGVSRIGLGSFASGTLPSCLGACIN